MTEVIDAPAAPAVEDTTAASAATTAAPAEAEAAPAPAPAAEPSAAPEKPEVPEPQNELTKKFTEEEWTALKEFKTKLPEIWRAAYTPDDPKAEPKPFDLWGIQIDPSAPSKDARVSVLLMKFLRARELRVDDAVTMMTATLRWRDEFKISEILDETFPEEIFGAVGRVYGKDKEGRPVNYNIYGGDVDLKQVFGDVPRFIRWRVQLMEKSVRLLDFETLDQMIQVHDYDGVSLMGGRDANQKAAAGEATNIFQNHYPEFLARKFFINVPTFLTWIFWAFKTVLSAKTFSKLAVVGTGKSTIAAALLPVIDTKELPKRYGGEAEGF